MLLEEDGEDQLDRWCENWRSVTEGQGERSIIQTVKRKRAVWIGHSLRRNCLLKHVIEGKIEGRIQVTGRRGRRRKQLLVHFKEAGGYWKLKEEALDRTRWRNGFGRGCGLVKGPCRMNDCGYRFAVRVKAMCVCLSVDRSVGRTCEETSGGREWVLQLALQVALIRKWCSAHTHDNH